MLGWCNSIICSAARPPNQAISRHLHPAKIPRKWMTDQTEGSRRGESAGDGHMQQGAIKRDGSCRGRHCRSLCIVSRPTRRDPREPPVFSAQLTRCWRGGRRAIGRPHWSKVSSTDLSHVITSYGAFGKTKPAFDLWVAASSSNTRTFVRKACRGKNRASTCFERKLTDSYLLGSRIVDPG